MPRSLAAAALAALLVAGGLAPVAHAQRTPARRAAARPPARAATPAQTPTVLQNPELAGRYAATITPEDLAAHLYLFASDEFEGRETSARGQKLAAKYLATTYRRLGLTPKGTAPGADPRAPERYFQTFKVYGQRLSRAALTVAAGGRTTTATFGPGAANTDLILGNGTAPRVEGGVVFGGYGIADSTLGYDDLKALRTAGVDVRGKWLLVLGDEPLTSAETSRLRTTGGAPSRWTMEPFSKLRAALPAGAAGLLVVGDRSPRAPGAFADRAGRAAAASQVAVGGLSLNPPQAGGGRSFPPILYVSSALADAILAPTGKTVAALQAEIDGSLRPTVFDVPGATVTTTVERTVFEASTENVAAFIEGSDPALRDEVVVLSSHYDHIGVNPALVGDVINNGADDDGSGTVATLEMAEAFMRAKADGHGPRRSILFLNVTGEEKGLLGSAYYADVEPLVPLTSTVTNLNIDMIGRFDPTEPNRSENYVYVIGSNLISRELDSLNTAVNRALGVNVELSQRFNSKDDPNQFYRRSDHWNFGKKGIPFIFYFTGTHPDYHGVGDEPQKIAYDRMARIARLIFGTAWQVANQDARPAVSGAGFN